MNIVEILKHFAQLSEAAQKELLREMISIYTKNDIGITNNTSIRMWTMGSLEHNIYPTKEAIEKLRSILKDCVNDGKLDLVWGPELTVKEI